MILPTIYEDAISCFCPRTAKMMRRYVWNYLSSGQIPAGLARFGKAPIAMLNLIFSNIELYNLFVKDKCNQIAPPADKCNQVEPHSAVCHHAASPSNKGNQKTNVSDKFNQVAPPEGCNQVEDEQKEKLSDEKNKTLLPPTPPINKTIKAENGKEKKEENSTTTAATTRAREEISADTENTNSVGLKTDGQEAKTSEPKTQGVTTEKKKEADEEIPPANDTGDKEIPPDAADDPEAVNDLEPVDDPDEIQRLLFMREQARHNREQFSEANRLIDYYNSRVGEKLPQVVERYPALLETARKAWAVLGSEKAKKVTDMAIKNFFICGENTVGFKANFIWIYSPEHYYKILNNEYYEHRHIDIEAAQRMRDNCQFVADQLAGKHRHDEPDDSDW